MRAYTSLLSHIIASNPDVLGYAEKHQSYRNSLDFLKMRMKARFLSKTWQTEPYIFDKVLHNKYKVSAQVLSSDHVIPIIMIRKPESTLKSIVNMGKTMQRNVRWYRDVSKVAQYYKQRLKTLEHYGQSGSVFTFIEAEQLISNSAEVLDKLTKACKVDIPFSEEYDTFAFSGTPALGDPSQNIKEGKVIKKVSDYTSITIPEDVLADCQRTYNSVIESLKQHSGRL